MNKFNIGDKVWFKLDSYGRKEEMRGTICDSINVGDGWCYNIETSDHKHWNIKEKDINYSAPHTRDYNREDEKYYAVGMPVRYAWGGPGPDNIRTGMIVENSDFRRGFYVIKDDRNGEKYNISANRIIGGYIYPVGAHIRYEDKKQIKCGTVVHHCKLYHESKEEWYYIREDGKSSSDKCDRILGCHILGYAAKWGIDIDDPSIRKAFGLDVKNDIYENIKKQINKDQLNFHYGLNSIFKLAPNDAAIPFELSEKEKEYVHNDMSATMSYLYNLHKNGFYGTGTDTKIVFNNIKEDNKMKKQQQKKRNRNIIMCNGKYQRTIKDISFNGPAVIVKFEPTSDDYAYGRFNGDKVVVVCKDDDKYDMKTGFLLAILKEFLNNQSYGNVLEKLDSFDALDIPQVGKKIDKAVEKETENIVFCKFQVGDIIRFKRGTARFKVDKRTTFTTKSGKVVPRYRLLRVLGTKYAYSTYANENELILADEVYQK